MRRKVWVLRILCSCGLAAGPPRDESELASQAFIWEGGNEQEKRLKNRKQFPQGRAKTSSPSPEVLALEHES